MSKVRTILLGVSAPALLGVGVWAAAEHAWFAAVVFSFVSLLDAIRFGARLAGEDV